MVWFRLVGFLAGFSAAILATPPVIRLAWTLGAVDRPDGFRKHHRGATPRIGGLAVVVGLASAVVFGLAAFPELSAGSFLGESFDPSLVGAALLVVLATGLCDDRFGVGPKTKLAAQTIAAILLHFAGFQLSRVFLFGATIDLGWLALPATCLWFLGCMNIWNLIDGMDGLASGVGLIVSVTVMISSAALGHPGVSFVAAALAGALAGFLVFNFHPARIFLGDTGSLFLGVVLGMLAIKGSVKSGMTVAVLTPLLAMGLPIVDTVLAIFRRWIRHVPWNSADHGHLHHRLLAFGLTPRQAALFLYSFAIVLGAAALASVALQSDGLALLFAGFGLAGLAVVYLARRRDLAKLVDDVRERLRHRRRERHAARIVWEGIQRLGSCPDAEGMARIVADVGEKLGAAGYLLNVESRGERLLHRWADFRVPATPTETGPRLCLRVTGATPSGSEAGFEFWDAAGAASLLTHAGPFLRKLHARLIERIDALVVSSARPAPKTIVGTAGFTIIDRRSATGALARGKEGRHG